MIKKDGGIVRYEGRRTLRRKRERERDEEDRMARKKADKKKRV